MPHGSVEQQRPTPTVQTAQVTAQTLQSPVVDKVDDMPVSMVHTVQSPVPTVEGADLAEAETSLAAVLASENSFPHATADHEVSVIAFAEELQVLADTTHVPTMRRLAQKEHSTVLPQLASRLSCHEVRSGCW